MMSQNISITKLQLHLRIYFATKKNKIYATNKIVDITQIPRLSICLLFMHSLKNKNPISAVKTIVPPEITGNCIDAGKYDAPTNWKKEATLLITAEAIITAYIFGFILSIFVPCFLINGIIVPNVIKRIRLLSNTNPLFDTDSY